MFRATHRPSARAQKLLLQPMVLYMFLVAGRCDGWASAVVMLDTPFSEVVCRVLATNSLLQFPLHFPSLASPCSITFQLESTCEGYWQPTLFASFPFTSLPSVTVCHHISTRVYLWRVLATNSLRQFPLHFPSLPSPCAITFQLESTCEGYWLTNSLRQFPLHFPSLASPCAITFQLESTCIYTTNKT